MISAMGPRGVSLVLSLAVLCRVVLSATDPGETLALQAFRKSLVDRSNNLANWQGDDPCSGWAGVYCVVADYPSSLFGSNLSHVTELRLLQFNLTGTLAPEIGNLPALKYLDLMWNQISGSIPTTISMLKNLNLLLLSGNQLTGVMPDELGLLPSLIRLQLDSNLLSGPIPPTFLDRNLPNIQHLHMNNNSFNGSIPIGISTLSTVHHMLFDNNEFTGTLPVGIASMPHLLIIQLDNNQFDSGATIPPEYGTIPQLVKLSLSNCNLEGAIPDFSLSTDLAVLDLSNNFLSGPIPNTTLSANLTSVDLSFNQLSGSIPENFGSSPALLYLELRNNNLSGLIPSNLGTGKTFADGTSTEVLDFQNNLITNFANGSNLVALQSQGKTKILLSGNPICSGAASQQNNPLCVPGDISVLMNLGIITYVPFPLQSSCAVCSSPYSLAPSSHPNICRCAVPILVEWRLKSPSFDIFDPYLSEFVAYLAWGLNLTVDQVQVKQYIYQPGPRFLFTLLFFPSTGSQFNDSEVSRIYGDFSQWKIPTNNTFGTYELLLFVPPAKDLKSTSHGLASAAIAGIVIGALAVVLLVLGCLLYFMRAWLRMGSDWDLKNDLGASRRQTVINRRSYSSIKVASVKSFTYDELSKATDGFSAARLVGKGGYGKVYSGVLEDGHKVAVKRAEEASHQGSHEFETEIHMLSRVHHRNLVSLIGFCNDQGEQMLVYEFIAYGSLQYHLSSSAKVPLSFATRLQIALGSARGLHYLHTQAEPPIYHRDVKTTNILLDEKFNAKVADFGLSKLAPEPDLEGMVGYVSTVVKGTPGYLDPEYFKTHRLTDKSDVYSFGVVMLVLCTGKQPIYGGKNLVREVNLNFNDPEEKLSTIVDYRILGKYPYEILESFVRLALSCCRDCPDDRPSIAEVVTELEQLLKKTYSDLTSCKDDEEFLAFSGAMLGNISDDSFIEINPSISSSVVSSTAWNASYPESSTTDVAVDADIDPR